MRPWSLLAAAFLIAAAGPAPAQPKARPTLEDNLRQIGLAAFNYEAAYQTFPPAAVADKAGKPLVSWRLAVLPYLEQKADRALAEKFKMDEAWDSDHNKKALADNPMPAVYALPLGPKPADKDAKKTHIQVFTGNGAAFDGVKRAKIFDFTDGTSNTILVALAKTPVDWTKPDDIAFDPKTDPRKLLLRLTRAGKPNDAAGFRFVRADGSVGGFDADVSEDELKTAITRSAGDVYDKKK